MRLVWKNNRETVREGQNKNDLVVVKWDGTDIELRDDQSGRVWKFKIPPQHPGTLDQFGLAWVENYPDHLVNKLEEDPRELQRLSPDEMFNKVLNYEGLIGYDYWIKQRILEIYGVQL